MKKGIYITTYNLQNQSDGVAKKILSQVKCMENIGYKMKVIDSNSEKKVSFYKIRKLWSKFFATPYVAGNLYQQVSELDDLQQYSFIYIRKGYLDKKQIKCLKKMRTRAPKTKILVEIPTYPYDQEFGGRRKIAVIPADKKYRNYYNGLIDRIVTYSDDKEIFNVPTINILNGIDYSRVQARSLIPHEGINLIAVAYFDIWHGYDRVLTSMAQDIKLVKEKNIQFHLVGDGRAVESYEKYVKDHDLQDYVHFYGRLFGEKLDHVFDIADIGIDTLGRHRVGVYYNSTLKGKEYCAKGLPIISGVKTDLDELNAFYYKRVPADDSPVPMQLIIDYYNEVYGQKSADEIVKNIRELTKEKFDFQNAFANVIDYIRER